jgi:hypothetical protein
MALSGSEVWRRGFVVDAATDTIVTVTDPTGTFWWGGFVRDPDGRLLVTS